MDIARARLAGTLLSLSLGAFAIAAPVAAASPNATAVPRFDHVYVVVMENRGYSSIVGSANAPYLNSLIKRYGLATNYEAVSHPSLPNYFALFGGSTFGARTDGRYDLPGSTVADQIEGAGLTWHVYEQDYPGHCSAASSAKGAVDLFGLAGYYFRKHDPAISFTDISHHSQRCSHITSLAGFDPKAANFEMIVPNTYNDMHSAPTSTGDAFLKKFVPLITNSPAFAHSLLLITWDEGNGSLGGGGQVATLVVSPLLKHSGMQSSVPHNHYSLLRTIETTFGLPCMRQTCQANTLGEFFG